MNTESESSTSAPPQTEAAPPHAKPIGEVLSLYGADAEYGLRSEQVLALRAQHGLNQLIEAPPTPLWRRLLGQFKDLVIWILIVAALISGARTTI